MLETRVEVEQDDKSVVDARPADAPLVHQCRRVRLRLGRRDVVAAEGLGVDHDLGLGLRLDGIDDLLGVLDGRRVEHAGVVVDRLPGDRLRERRTGRRWRGRGRGHRAGRDRQAPDQRADEREREAKASHRSEASHTRAPVLTRGSGPCGLAGDQGGAFRRHRAGPGAAWGGRCRSRTARRRTRRRRRSRRGRRDGAAAGRARRASRWTRRSGPRPGSGATEPRRPCSGVAPPDSGRATRQSTGRPSEVRAITGWRAP